MQLSNIEALRVDNLFGKLKTISGNVVKDMLLNKGTKGTNAKNRKRKKECMISTI